MQKQKTRVSSGVSQLDLLLGGLFIGDNVIWYDDAGSLASLFSLNFIQASQLQNKPIIYVSFDRSPKNLIATLGQLAENQHLTILDCFTHGKGDGSEIFDKFYEKNGAQWPYQIIKINEPWKPSKISDAVYHLHAQMQGDVRFVFESITGMQNLWGGEDQIIKFYTHTCPKLYELDTIAYWIVEKNAHSNRLKAHINQVAQVSIDLAVKRGKSFLTLLKAEKREPDTLNKPVVYSSDGLKIHFDNDVRGSEKIDLGSRLKSIRNQQGISQKELARLVGVTPSTISQVESNLIYPSLPALYKIAEILAVELSTIFKRENEPQNLSIFNVETSPDVNFADLPKGSISGKMITPIGFEAKSQAYLIEIAPKKTILSHFFLHKGEELGYLLAGSLRMIINNREHHVKTGQLIHLTTEMPSQWKNAESEPARLLWVRIR